jgi:hypothetical protein
MSNNYLFSMYVGDTYLDVYGYEDKDDPTVGHVGGIDIEDVCTCDTKTSVLEMIIALNFDEFNKQAHQAWAERNDK